MTGVDWTVTDPHAPDRPVVPPAGVETRRPRWTVPAPGRGKILAWLMLIGVTAFAVPRLYVGLATYLVAPVTDATWVPPEGTVQAGGAVLVALAALVALGRAVARARGRRHRTRAEQQLADAAQARRTARAEAHRWAAQHQVRRDQLPEGPLRVQADRLMAALDALERTRAVRDEWIDAGLRRTVRAKRWSLLARLRDSVATRADLATSAELAVDHPDLARAAAARAAEIAALDTELAELTRQLET
ncbi:hypothetical protein, partial [Amycolatopsis sp. NPDC051903]|uniref:hypothetical protein n=1 Tax=Amycolatopsis sp. NPDC051903 TaxID=3363936 RepID=UPI00378AE65C